MTDATVPTGLTPSQTVGPFLHIGLPWADGPFVVPEGTPGALRVVGTVSDGNGAPVTDGLLETWQADPQGRFDHADDPRRVAWPTHGFRGFGRCPTDAEGRYHVLTVKPGSLPVPEGGQEAPHINVSIFARGLLDRVVTRIYFPDEEQANAADPVLAAVADPARRSTLIARPDAAGLRFDIRLQGDDETVFFTV